MKKWLKKKIKEVLQEKDSVWNAFLQSARKEGNYEAVEIIEDLIQMQVEFVDKLKQLNEKENTSEFK